MTGSEFLLELPVGLPNQLYHINILNIQLQIAGTGLRSFHQILCQILQALGFLIQNLQITLNFGILDIFPLD